MKRISKKINGRIKLMTTHQQSHTQHCYGNRSTKAGAGFGAPWLGIGLLVVVILLSLAAPYVSRENKFFIIWGETILLYIVIICIVLSGIGIGFLI
jgi:hypothetical protein